MLPLLDERLQAAYAYYPQCALGADIGTDHGRLPLHLLANGVADRMVVADISPDALDKARRLLTLHQLADRADIRTADGLNALTAPAQCISILGMGGDTLLGILQRGQARLCGAALVLSVHTMLPMVRAGLAPLHYRLEKETIVYTAGRYYIIMKAVPGEEALDEKARLLGPRLLESPPPLWPQYLKWREGVALAAFKALRQARTPGARLTEMERLLAYIHQEAEKC